MKLIKCRCITWFGYDGITFGKYVFLTEEASKDPKFVKHEECHVLQYRQYGFIGFLVRYIYYFFKYGYINNPFEVEARKYAES